MIKDEAARDTQGRSQGIQRTEEREVSDTDGGEAVPEKGARPCHYDGSDADNLKMFETSKGKGSHKVSATMSSGSEKKSESDETPDPNDIIGGRR